MMMISIGNTTVMARGMPGGMQVKVGSLPWPPAAWSARLASNSAWYCGLSGGCSSRPSFLLGSHWTPPMRRHWPRHCRIFGFIEREGVGDRDVEPGQKRERTDQGSIDAWLFPPDSYLCSVMCREGGVPGHLVERRQVPSMIGVAGRARAMTRGTFTAPTAPGCGPGSASSRRGCAEYPGSWPPGCR